MHTPRRGVDALGQRGVDVHGLRHVGVAGADVYREHRLVHQVAPVWSGDVAAQDPVGGRVDDELDQPSGVARRAGLGHPGEVLPADDHLVARGPGLRLGQPDRADLGIDEHRVRDDPPRDAAVLVAEHGAVDDVRVVARGVGE